MVKEQMEFHRPLRATELRPVEERGAEIDDGGIQAQELFLEPELPAPFGHRLAALKQLEEDLLVQRPGPMLIGIGQAGALRGRDPQVAELALAAGQAAADLPEGLRPAQLAKEHGHKLAPGGEAAGVPFGLRGLDGLLKVEAREGLEELAEHAHEPIHC